VIAKVVKNKVGVPWRQMEFDLVDGVGFDRLRHLIELGVSVGVVGKKGAFYEVPGLPKAVQGLQTLVGVLSDSRAENVVDVLEGAVLTTLENAQGVVMATVEDDDQEVAGDSEVVDEG
jgi:recombination protein RecA